MVNIIKADGRMEAFKPAKLKNSLAKAGADAGEVADILGRIERELYEGMTTEEIYRKAFEYLRAAESVPAARYSLRRALFGLGPTGFPFEDFLARIFQAEGYAVRTGIMLEGACVPHEIDVAAHKPDHSFVAEAKFHARPGIKSDVQVALYCYARKLDLAGIALDPSNDAKVTEFMIITNTKFTSMAERYAACNGLTLLSWDYPKKGNLHDRIRATGLYPITVLSTLSNAQKQLLLAQGAIVCSDIVEKPHILRRIHISPKKTEAVLLEARQLCQ